MKQKAFYEMIDSLTVIHGVISLCLDGTLGELSDQQRENLMMAERHVWDLNRSIGELMGVKIDRVYRKLRA